MTDERRGSPRLAASLAGEIETTEGKSSIAISRDVSPGGLMVFSRSRPEAGTPIKLKVMFKGETLELAGTVLRCEELEFGASTLWRTRIAIAIDSGDPVLGRIYAAIAAEPPEPN